MQHSPGDVEKEVASLCDDRHHHADKVLYNVEQRLDGDAANQRRAVNLLQAAWLARSTTLAPYCSVSRWRILPQRCLAFLHT